ncbi:MAG TPA: dienelactone hydrolase family protein [Alphaproteobacteria bacterium]|nr:dienelactone hydrolase family protein [Alphaproteobacteria bacterium]
MASRTLTIAAVDGGTFAAHFALPEAGRGPGILLLHDAFGLNPHARLIADHYAEEGYVVLAPDLYWRLGPGISLGYSDAEQREAAALRARFDCELALRDIGAALAALRARAECTGKAAVLGIGLGGRLAYGAAERWPLDAMVSYHGIGIARELGETGAVKCPMLLHYAGADPALAPGAVEAIRKSFAWRDDVEIHVYAGVRPGFGNPERPEVYHRPSAWMAHSRTIALLRRTMGPHYDLPALWEKHCEYEFAVRDVAATMRTMVASPYVNHIPTMTGGVGYENLARFYKHHFIPRTPKDTQLIPISRTVGADRVVDEMLFRFTHDIEMDWMLPGIPPTGRRVEIPLVAIVNFRGDKLYHEHIYWDQASVLVQIGVLDPAGLPVTGVEQARKLVDETLPSNALMGERWHESAGKPVE